ncbi:Osmotin-like protein [Linum perenne]
MAPSHLLYAVVSLLLLTLTQATAPLTLTLVNNCPFTVYPAIQPSAGSPILLNGGGFPLHHFTHKSFPAPNHHWSGRIWARTHCSHTPDNKFRCLTGDCANRLECNGLGGATPATLVQLTLHHGSNDFSSYGVSLVDGYNVPLTVTPHEGKGNCPVVGCQKDLLPGCPDKLKVWGPHGWVVACKSGCEAFGTDELCCRNHYNSPHTCRPSSFSQYFKRDCPSSFTFAHDTPSLMHDCSSPRELKVIFCH